MLMRFPKRYSGWNPVNWWGLSYGAIDQRDYLPDERRLYNKLRERYAGIFGGDFKAGNANEHALYGDFFSWGDDGQRRPYLEPADDHFAIEGSSASGNYFGSTCPIVTFYGKEACRNFVAWRAEQLKRNSFSRNYENSPRMLTAAFFIDATRKLTHMSELDLLAEKEAPGSGLRRLELYIEFADVINNDDFFPSTYKGIHDVNMQWALQNFKKHAKKMVAGINAYRLNKTAKDYFKYLHDAVASIRNNVGRCFLYLLAEQEISQAAIDYTKEDHVEWKNIQNTFAQQIVFYVLAPSRLDAIAKGNCVYDIEGKIEKLIQQHFGEESLRTTASGLANEILRILAKNFPRKIEFLESFRNAVKLILALNCMQNMLEAAIKLADSEGDRGIYLGTDLIINKLLPAIGTHMDALSAAFDYFIDSVWKFSEVVKETRGGQTEIKIELGRQHNIAEARKICLMLQSNLSEARKHGIDFARQIVMWQSRPQEMLFTINAARDAYKKNWQIYKVNLQKLGIDFIPIETKWSRMSTAEREILINEWGRESAMIDTKKITHADLIESSEKSAIVVYSLPLPAHEPANIAISDEMLAIKIGFSNYVFGNNLILQILGWFSCCFVIPVFYVIYKIGEYYTWQQQVSSLLPMPEKQNLPIAVSVETKTPAKEPMISPLSKIISQYYEAKGELGSYIKSPGWKGHLMRKVAMVKGSDATMSAITDAIKDLAGNRIAEVNLSTKVSAFLLDPSRLGMLYAILWAMLEAERENGGLMRADDARFFLDLYASFEHNKLLVTKSAERMVSQEFALDKVFRGEINLLGFNHFNFVQELQSRCVIM